MKSRWLGTQGWFSPDNEAYRDRPILYDLFCGAGGAAWGYYLAGFQIVGIDIRPQPRYPFTFIQYNALSFIEEGGLEQAATVHASPPCKHHTQLKHLRAAQGLEPSDGDFLEETRELLAEWGGLYLIENVPNAPLVNSATLCGTQFGLSWAGRQLQRHRWFESSFKLRRNGCKHSGKPWGIYGRLDHEIPNGGVTPPTLDAARSLMGISWMNWKELKESIPPAYTEFLGLQMLARHRELESCTSLQ